MAEEYLLREERKRLSASFLEFCRAAWPLIEPTQPLSENLAFQAIALHLQGITEEKLRKLICNVPPRFSKSTLVAVLWPCWEWTRDPSRRYLFATYSLELSRRDSRRRRWLIGTDWYQKRWPIRLLDDANTVTEFANDQQGTMIATSVGATVTGRGGSRLVLDDANSATDGQSEQVLASVREWLDGVWATRKDNPATCAEVLIQQRLNEQDATGHLLGQGGYELLRLPMEFEPSDRCRTSLWEDPRQEEGELLDPKRFPQDEVDSLKKRLGPYGSAGQLQQRPAPLEGGIVRREWLRSYVLTNGAIDIREDGFIFMPQDVTRFCTVDLAVASPETTKKTDPDFTVLAAWATAEAPNGRILVLLDLIRERIEGPDFVPRLKAFHDHWKFGVIGVETVGYQLAAAQAAKREGLPVREMSNRLDALYRLDRDKTARLFAATPLMADGRFYVPTYAPWLADYMRELLVYPNSSHDDCVDVTSAAVAIASKLPSASIFRANSPMAVQPSQRAGEGRPMGSTLQGHRPDDTDHPHYQPENPYQQGLGLGPGNPWREMFGR